MMDSELMSYLLHLRNCDHCRRNGYHHRTFRPLLLGRLLFEEENLVVAEVIECSPRKCRYLDSVLPRRGCTGISDELGIIAAHPPRVSWKSKGHESFWQKSKGNRCERKSQWQLFVGSSGNNLEQGSPTLPVWPIRPTRANSLLLLW